MAGLALISFASNKPPQTTGKMAMRVVFTAAAAAIGKTEKVEWAIQLIATRANWVVRESLPAILLPLG